MVLLPSVMSTAVLATALERELSVKSPMVICSVPSLRPSALREWEKEKEPVRETMPEPLRSPLSKSVDVMPLPERVQKSVVPGLTFLVLTVVVSVSPSLRVVEEGASS